MEVQEESRFEHRVAIPRTKPAGLSSYKVELLGRLDKTPVQYYHWTAIIIACCGFYTDAYDLFCLSSVTNLLGRIYFHDSFPSQPGMMPMKLLALLNLSALCGSVGGCIFFGILGDKVGRKRTYTFTCMLLIFGTVGSGLSYAKSGKSLIVILSFFRFWLGFGVGGSYPSSSTIMAEYANIKSRGACLSAIFAMQGCGILAAAGVAIVVAEAFKRMFPCGGVSSSCIPPRFDTPKEADYVWRIILCLGAVPALFTLYFRSKLPETPRYTVLVEGDVKKATENMNKILTIKISASAEQATKWKRGGPGLFTHDFISKFGWRLLAVSCAYFMVDMSYYSQVQFQRDVLSDVGWLPPATSLDGLREVSLISQSMALLALLACVPGYWVTVCTVEWLGRRAIQLQGFFFLSVVFLSIGLNLKALRGSFCGSASQAKWCDGHPTIFIGLYGAMYFFFSFGANTTTFILPAELFPTRLRSTCAGISAFVGKIGACCGMSGFLFIRAKIKTWPAQEYSEIAKVNPSIRTGFLLLACCCAIGFVVTVFLIPDTSGQSLEEIAFEETMDNSSGECWYESSAIQQPSHVAPTSVD